MNTTIRFTLFALTLCTASASWAEALGDDPFADSTAGSSDPEPMRKSERSLLRPRGTVALGAVGSADVMDVTEATGAAIIDGAGRLGATVGIASFMDLGIRASAASWGNLAVSGGPCFGGGGPSLDFALCGTVGGRTTGSDGFLILLADASARLHLGASLAVDVTGTAGLQYEASAFSASASLLLAPSDAFWVSAEGYVQSVDDVVTPSGTLGGGYVVSTGEGSHVDLGASVDLSVSDYRGKSLLTLTAQLTARVAFQAF
jgi:hypothetical protein